MGFIAKSADLRRVYFQDVLVIAWRRMGFVVKACGALKIMCESIERGVLLAVEAVVCQTQSSKNSILNVGP